jgi:glycosyltransferase involved in cell wall biosynthesis
MHIGIDASRLAIRHRTGTEHYTYALLAALAQLDRHTHYTLYANTPPATLPPLGSNVDMRLLPFPRLWTHLRLGAEMVVSPPDVLFVPAHVIPLSHTQRSVVTIHDLGYLAFPQAHTPQRWLDLHASTWWNTQAAHHIITISHATKQALMTHYRVPADKITVIHHGVAPRFAPVQDRQQISAVKQRYGIPTNDAYLLYIGTVHPRKNLERLIDSFALMFQGSSGTSHAPLDTLRLVIAGQKGWLTETIERRGAERGIADRVGFTGYVPDEDIPALLSGALAFVFPSLYEGFGMPVLEAMACHTPVLTSTTTSLPEVAGDAALLVNPNDTNAIAEGMSRLVNDPALRDTLRERGSQHAATFTWERCARETLRVLQSAGE